MDEETKRLESVINSFRFYFDDRDNTAILDYKKNLFKHVRQQLKDNITLKCGENLKRQIKQVEQDMLQGLQKMKNISDTGNESIKSTESEQNPENSFTNNFEQFELERKLIIDAPSIGTEFQEDLSFNFSYSVSNIINRLMSSRNCNLKIIGDSLSPISNFSTSISNTITDTKSLLSTNTQNTSKAINSVFTVTKIVSATPQITTVLTAGYGAYRVIGWRMVAFIGGAYLSVYTWERIMWNTRAKERALKRQFAKHAKNHIFKRRLDAAEESSIAMEKSLQFRKENFEKKLDDSKIYILTQIEATQKQIKDVERVQNVSKKLKNEANFIKDNVNRFGSKYLTNCNWVDLDIGASRKSLNEIGVEDVKESGSPGLFKRMMSLSRS